MPARARKSPKRPAQQRGAETRHRILAAALAEFASHGFEGAMTRDIAAAAGVHQPVINYYFDGKEGLWKAAVDFSFDQLRERFAARLLEIGQDDPIKTMRTLLRDFVLFNARHPEFPRVLLHVASAPSPLLDWIVERHMGPMYESVIKLIEKIRRAGHWKSVPAANFYHIINGAAASIFVMAPAVTLISNANPLSEKNSAAHADAVAELFFPTSSAKVTRTIPGGRRGQTRRPAPSGSSRTRRRNS